MTTQPSTIHTQEPAEGARPATGEPEERRHGQDPVEGIRDAAPDDDRSGRAAGSTSRRPHRWLAAGGFGAVVAGAAALGSRFSPADPGTGRWFGSLDKPPFQPPNTVFAPVWSTLYPMIAASGWRVWQAEDQPRRRLALGLWATQMAANAAWTPVFFGARRPKAALAVLGVQLASTVAFVAAAREVDRPAAVLMGPYLAWTGFAGAINEEIVRRNP